MFEHISKQREQSWKYDARMSIFDEFRGIENVLKHCLKGLLYLNLSKFINEAKPKEKM